MPGIPFPAICTTPSCGAFFLADRIVGVPDGSQARVEVKDFGAGPCPKCGGFGVVPDGVYSLFESTIRDPHEAEIVRRFMEILERHIRFPTSLPKMMNELSAEGIPTSAWKPKNVTELVALLGIIVVVLQFMYSVYKDHRPAPVPPRISDDAKQVIEMILDRSIQHTPPPAPPPTEPPAVPNPPAPPTPASK